MVVIIIAIDDTEKVLSQPLLQLMTVTVDNDYNHQLEYQLTFNINDFEQLKIPELFMLNIIKINMSKLLFPGFRIFMNNKIIEK